MKSVLEINTGITGISILFSLHKDFVLSVKCDLNMSYTKRLFGCLYQTFLMHSFTLLHPSNHSHEYGQNIMNFNLWHYFSYKSYHWFSFSSINYTSKYNCKLCFFHIQLKKKEFYFLSNLLF